MEFIEDAVAIINCCMKKPWHPTIFSTSFTKAKLYQEFILLLLLLFYQYYCYWSLNVSGLAVTHVSSIGIPSHRTYMVGCFVMLPNLAWLTVSYSGCCRCCVSLVFSRGSSWCSFQWLVAPIMMGIFLYHVFTHSVLRYTDFFIFSVAFFMDTVVT